MATASKAKKKTVRLASGRKRVRQDEKINAANTSLRSKFRTVIKNVQKALDKAAGFFRSQLGQRLALKHIPEIRFEFDRNLEYANHLNKVLDALKPAAPAAPETVPETEAAGQPVKGPQDV